MKRLFIYLLISVFTFGGLKCLTLRNKTNVVVKRETESQIAQEIKPDVTEFSDNKDFTLKDKAHILLKKGGHKDPKSVRILSHDDTSCSNDCTIWINTGWELGPQDYVLAHECGHVVCEHYKKRCDYAEAHDDNDMPDAAIKAQEKEADLTACRLLCELGLQGIVEDRIKEIQYAIDQKWRQTDTNDHPGLQEMVDYMREFLNEYKQKQA
jgi:hypothetical protein